MKLYRFAYSSYARYVQAALDLAGAPHEVVDVPFGDRNELAVLTGGYVMVPVLVLDDGTVLMDSRHILQVLVRDDARFASLVPAADAGPIWAYADWAGSILEDTAFRLASPSLAERFPIPFERALFVFVKERKFGAGCVAAWASRADELFSTLERLLVPTAQTLGTRAFLFGEKPTLADAALYGQMAMLDMSVPDRVAALPGNVLAWKARVEKKLGPPPYGPVARAHRARSDIQQAHDEASRAPRAGNVERIVLRTAVHERACPEEAELDPAVGLVGDRWSTSGAKVDAQLSLMDVRVASALSDRDDWRLFGDNLLVDLDLGRASLNAGDRLNVGTAVVEITDKPHTGCRKFSARFGHEALLWVNDREHRDRRRRGIFARVVEAGKVRVGDRVRRA